MAFTFLFFRALPGLSLLAQHLWSRTRGPCTLLCRALGACALLHVGPHGETCQLCPEDTVARLQATGSPNPPAEPLGPSRLSQSRLKGDEGMPVCAEASGVEGVVFCG